MKEDVRMPIGTQPPDSLLASQLAEAVNAIAPQALTDGKVDLERLKQALGDHVETGRERYGLTWPGKAEAIKAAQRPSLGTLRPKPGEGINEDSTGNLIIEGDNLEVLKLLQKAYLGKIKMIYIDPPYNTGNDFVYEDNFADPLAGYLEQTGQTVDGKRLSTNTETAGRYHSNWLSMMYPRLTLARNLLREDGVIFISIDDNEVANLRKICDEVFGEENFVGSISRESIKGGSVSLHLRKVNDFVLIYAKDFDQLHFSGIEQPDRELEHEDQFGKYAIGRELNKWGAGSRREDSPSMWFAIKGPNGEDVFPFRNDGSEGRWRLGRKRMKELSETDGIIFEKRPNGTYIAYQKIRSNKTGIRQFTTLFVEKYQNSKGTDSIKKLFKAERSYFDYAKPVNLIVDLMILSAVQENDVILDFFAGSGTTAQAVLEMNEEDGGSRKFILVQLPEVVDEDSAAAKAGFANIAEITKERVRRVIKKLDGGTTDGLGLDGTKNLDRGFKVYALDRSNFVPWDATAATDAASLEKQLELAVDNVLHDRSHADLLAEILLKTGFPLDTPITTVTIAGTDVYQVADPGFLVCLAEKVDAPLIKAIAATKPHRVVILDAAFQGNDALKTNAVQAFKDQGVEMFRTA